MGVVRMAGVSAGMHATLSEIRIDRAHKRFCVLKLTDALKP